MTFKYTSTKEYVEAFPVAYRQWRADDKPGPVPGCNKIHGYALSVKLFFGANELDKRNWVVDYGSLRDLKAELASNFDHTLLVAEDDPQIEWFLEAHKRDLAKVIVLKDLGCEAIADLIYNYVNSVFIPTHFGAGEADRVWCYRVEVRETQANMAFREGNRDL